MRPARGRTLKAFNGRPEKTEPEHSVSTKPPTSCWAERVLKRVGENLNGVPSRPMGQNSLSVMALAY